MTSNHASKISIRNGSPSDLKTGLDLIRTKIPEKSNLSLEDVLDKMKSNDCRMKIAEMGGALAGIFIWYGPYEKPGECYLWLGAVKESREGIGSMLMESVLKDMKSLGYSAVRVKSKSSNASAAALLKKHGFRPCSRDKDGIVMLLLSLGHAETGIKIRA